MGSENSQFSCGICWIEHLCTVKCLNINCLHVYLQSKNKPGCIFENCQWFTANTYMYTCNASTEGNYLLVIILYLHVHVYVCQGSRNGTVVRALAPTSVSQVWFWPVSYVGRFCWWFLPCYEAFSTGPPVFLLPEKPTLQISIWQGQRAHLKTN